MKVSQIAVVAALSVLGLAGCGHEHKKPAPADQTAVCKPEPYDMASQYHSMDYYQHHPRQRKQLIQECNHAPCIADGSSPNCTNADQAQQDIEYQSSPNTLSTLSKALN